MHTPYAAHKIVNSILDRHELKNIPPQMMYNYVKKGYIKSENGLISDENLQEWVVKYMTKKVAISA